MTVSRTLDVNRRDLRRGLLMAAASLTLWAPRAWAQEGPTATAGSTPAPPPAQAAPAKPAQADNQVDEVVVSGMRATQRNSIAVKRESTVIVDGLVNDEIGSTPDNSVGETLERITGVTSDRFKGSASEISVRGLGPFLGFSTLNGRELSSGSGDRAVSFQQFPSELVSGVLVYKSQQADFVEGGVSGVVELKTLRPLDYGKRRFQFEARGNYLPYNDRVSGSDKFGTRFAGSYTDRFDTRIGEIGVSLGFATTNSSAPEDFYATSTSWVPCNTVNPTPSSLTAGNCAFVTGSANPTYLATSSYSFRQIITRDKRKAVIGALQWRPNDIWDFNLDVQLSRRKSFEDRNDLSIAEGRRGVTPLEVEPNGALSRWSGNSILDIAGTIRNRMEDYDGGGFAAKFTPNDALTITTDLSYSKTHRNEVNKSTRLRSGTAFGVGGRVLYTMDQKNSDIPTATFTNAAGAPIDLMNYAAFNTGAFANRQMDDRTDEIAAGRIDALYELGDGFIESLKAGLRYSDHQRVTDLGNTNNLATVLPANITKGNAECRIPTVVRDWGKDGGTNVQNWAQFSTQCLYAAFTGVDDLGPAADSRSQSDLDITEKITAGYAMANFRSEWGGVPVSGNFGVRVIKTNIKSLGYRGDYTVENASGTITIKPIPGSFAQIRIDNEFTNVLPSANIHFKLRDDVSLRAAYYRAMARSNIEAMGAGRNFTVDSGATTVETALRGVSGGNPRLEALDSWNGDLSLEYYPDRDTSFTAALFYKKFKAAAVPAAQGSLVETLVIGGVSFTVPVNQQINSDDPSTIFGVEFTVNKAFTFLPAPFDGFGVQANLTLADSDFEFPDPSAIDPLNPLANFTDPVGFNGLSKRSGSVTGYYEKDKVSLRLVYKYRSDYFKANGNAPNRVTDAAGYLDFSGSYALTQNVQLKVQAINLNNGHSLFQRPVAGSNGETSYFGTSYFAGVRLRF
jgi:TonB-dependent receptor